MAQADYELIKAVFLLLDDGDQRFLRRYELNPTQFYMLFWLRDGEKNMRQLSQRLLCNPSNVTRIAAGLERRGLVQRRGDPADRRSIWLELTPSGGALFDEAHQAHEIHVSQRMNILGPEEQAGLAVLLEKLSAGLSSRLKDGIG